MHAKVGMRFPQIETTRADLGDLKRSSNEDESDTEDRPDD